MYCRFRADFPRMFSDSCSGILTQKKAANDPHDASAVGSLIFILAILVTLYILAVPPDVREDILRDSDDSGFGDDDGFDSGKELITLLVDAQPGTLQYVTDNQFYHDMPAFHLKESRYSNVLAEENPFVLRRSWFSNAEKRIDFRVDSVREVTSIKIGMNAQKHKGNLIMEINGNEFFNQEVAGGYLNPVEIPLSYIGEENVLTLKLSSPDLAFWKANVYDISNLRVNGDFADLSTLENTQRFYLESVEKNNEISESRLVFSPSCNVNAIGKLTILLNSQTIYSSIPDCNTLNIVHFKPDILDDDENLLTFNSARGDYVISLASVRTQLEDTDAPTYYFELTKDTFNKLDSRDYFINVSVAMQDNEKHKEAYVLVNSIKFFLDTRDNVWWKRIPAETLQEGTNTLEIQPLNTFETIRFQAGLYD